MLEGTFVARFCSQRQYIDEKRLQFRYYNFYKDLYLINKFNKNKNILWKKNFDIKYFLEKYTKYIFMKYNKKTFVDNQK